MGLCLPHICNSPITQVYHFALYKLNRIMPSSYLQPPFPTQAFDMIFVCFSYISKDSHVSVRYMNIIGQPPLPPPPPPPPPLPRQWLRVYTKWELMWTYNDYIWGLQMNEINSKRTGTVPRCTAPYLRRIRPKQLTSPHLVSLPAKICFINTQFDELKRP